MGRTLLKSICVRNGAIHSLTASNNCFPREYSWFLEKDTEENRSRWKKYIEDGIVIPLRSCENNKFIKSLKITHYWDGKPFNVYNREIWRRCSI